MRIQEEKSQPLLHHNYNTYLVMKKVATHEQYSTNPKKIKLLYFPLVLQSMLQSGFWERAVSPVGRDGRPPNLIGLYREKRERGRERASYFCEKGSCKETLWDNSDIVVLCSISRAVRTSISMYMQFWEQHIYFLFTMKNVFLL